jgi:hypothetical protein
MICEGHGSNKSVNGIGIRLGDNFGFNWQRSLRIHIFSVKLNIMTKLRK